MSRTAMVWHAVAITAICSLMPWWLVRIGGSTSSHEYPDRPIQVVVPYKAGGGSDTFVRIVQQGIIEDGLLGQPLVIINQDGGIGTIGSREVKNAEPNGYKILCHHNAIITAQLTGTVPFGPEAFEPIALTGEMSMVVLCRGDAPYANIADLLRQARESPKAVRFGANKGAPAYFTALQLEKAFPGAEFSIVSAGGGADRYAKILGGHLEAGIFSLSEYLDFRGPHGTPPEQNVRAIALLGPQRHESVPDVPTAIEMNVPVVLTNANYWWAPKETPRPIIDKLATVLRSAMRNTTVRRELQRLRMAPTFEQGETFERRLQATVRGFQAVAQQRSTELPNFPLLVALVLAALLIWVALEWVPARPTAEPSWAGPDDGQRRPRTAAAAVFVLCFYILLLGHTDVPLALATAAMVTILGGLMLVGQHRQPMVCWVILVELALLTGLSAEFIFTEIFVIALP